MAGVKQRVGVLHLIHSRRQQLYNGEILARSLHGLPGGPVVKGALHLNMAAAMTPCTGG